MPGAPATTPAKGTKLKPALVIGVVVGVVALIGVVGAVIGGGKDADAKPSRSSSSPTVPLGAVVLDPSAGPQPDEPTSTTPVPGPGTDPVVTAPPTTTIPPPTTVPQTGNEVEVGDGVSVVPASGWSVDKQEGGFVQLSREGGGAQLFVSLYDSSLGSTVPEAASNYLSGSIQPYLAELETTEVEDAGALSASVVGNGTFEYRGVIASQGGNTPVEGFVVVFVRADGTVVVYEEMNEQGTYETVKDEYGTMLNSIVPTL